MKKATACLIAVLFMYAAMSQLHAKPPTEKHYVVSLKMGSPTAAAVPTFLLKFDAILPCNLVEFTFPSYRMAWTIGEPSGQLHEHNLVTSNATNLTAAGIHRLRNSK